MNISILTLFPDLFKPFLDASIIGRARERGLLTTQTVSLLDMAEPKKRIDAPPYGPGPGMLIKPEIIEKAIDEQEKKWGTAYRIFFSPQGKKLDQRRVRELAHIISNKNHIMLVCPRYEGLDDRVEKVYADELISIGDFVVMGGDLPAMILLEGLLRYVPGVVGKNESVEQESFSGPFLDYPQYTQPLEWKGMQVPEVLRSGNHAQIAAWRMSQAAERTVLHHFDWARSCSLDAEEKKLVRDQIPHHYVALMHTGVMGRDGTVGTTSVTSLDMHDIARSACTYGVERYFIVTPLEDQQKIVQTMLDFWKSDWAVAYNPSRHEAVERVRLAADLQSVIQDIESREGVAPVVIATSAREILHKQSSQAQGEQSPDQVHAVGAEKVPAVITYHDQETVWQCKRPVLILLGTGGGLAADTIKQADFVLVPVQGLTDFNHLSVRSAAAVILDRWLGISVKK